ncbi:hypothetical protein [Flavilitoribacter nigricans]|uniref:Uncharacterized protein n=1 Tax=Flavilitoribacter nigricans (strain ATCC 23147 / DSM 23189 / NBRC 102662 / NCIMB 1420 / SS-2) TaxID=1122177 RepID=A0A2D0NAP1_FLAN2|nr:hypothetical protein [Flavilitoribacter nigricans]PHN05574.1 hypothetical protein CRP01_16425 [Flavilitoribacter nigricans DSM 23189 = NBRC 102662]
MRNLILLFMTLFISSINLQAQSKEASLTAIQPYESFVFLEKDTVGMENRRLLTTINLKSTNYDVLLKKAEKEARRLGGNCLLITSHKAPNPWATRHRIKAKVFRIDNPESFEKEIPWHPSRPLKVCNFRGDRADNPLPSASTTAIDINIFSDPESGKTKAIIEARFKNEKSFFTPSAGSDDRLAIEQLVFDLTEVYARKLRKIIVEEVSSSDELIEIWQSKAGALLPEWYGKRNEFLEEVAENSDAQEQWREWVNGELDSLQAYNQTEFLLALR